MERFSVWRTIKIGLFNVGSALVDIFTASVWNRIMISDLGAGATPVSFVLALRYLLAPLSLWIGLRSDTRPLLGLRRLPYIWLGRLFMLIAIVLLPFSTSRLALDLNDAVGWLIAGVIFVFYGLGTAISGGPYLALIHDSVPVARRGLAISITQMLLLVGFAFWPILFARLLPSYTAEQFQSLSIIGAICAGVLWVVSIVGEERRRATDEVVEISEPKVRMRDTFQQMWADSRARIFFFFLMLGAIASFAQDAVLEPFGGDVFDMQVDETTRFNSYFGTAVLLAMLIVAVITRRRRPEEQAQPARIGLSVMIVGLGMLALSGLTLTRWLIYPGLLVFGLGFGAYTIGGVSLIMAMTSPTRAGAYLGLWTMTQLVSRGLGIGLGGLMRDVVLSLSNSLAVAYSSVFILEAIGLGVCILLLARLDVRGFASEHQTDGVASPLIAMAD